MEPATLVCRVLRQRALFLAPLAALMLFQPAGAQTRFSYSSGQSVSPAYEGWWANDDGSFSLFFGYMNTNWEEEFDIPIGADNSIEPAGPDQGQPTHFYPRRNPFLFTVRVPRDFGKKELVWTITSNGKTERAYASLKADYLIDKQTISTEVGGDQGSLRDELRNNVPPELKVEGAKSRSGKVGEALTLVALANDPDNLPARRGGRGSGAGGAAQPGGGSGPPAGGAQPGAGRAGPANPTAAAAVPRPPISLAARSGAGLRLSWIVYRGNAAMVTFDPEQMETWMDTRAYANSPWASPFTIPEPPPEGKYTVHAMFREPGTYVLRAIVSDGSLFTNENVTVTVTR